tara:strand:- start:43 stop:1470 length:1428 start_codon:yes stop_codon:yes gene_type:complete
MAIIYTYPTKATPANDDLILISDSADSNKTKQIKVSSLPGGSSSGVSALNTLTGAVTITGGTNVTLNTAGSNIEINATSGGGTPATPTNSVQFNNASAFGGSANLTFATDTLAVTHTVDIKGDGSNAGKLKLYCENTTTPHAVTIEGPANSGATAYGVKLPSAAPSNQQILQSDVSGNLSWINTPSSGGGGSVDSVNTTDGTFINLTPNSATTGAVSVTADLSATGTAGNTTFLRGDNQWIIPTNTTYSVMGSGNSYAAGLVLAGNVTHSDQYLRKDGTWVVPTNTTSIALTTTGTSGASTWNGTTLNIPQYSGGGGSGASLGFAPLEIYSANTITAASYIYYMVAVCDVDFTVNKCKVAVTSGTGPVYVTVYSMDYGSLQTSTLTKLGALNNSASIAGVNEISLTESAFSLTAGQTICIGVGTANLLSAAAGINNTDLGVMATSGGGGGALPATPDFESLGTANKRPAIHFYAS